MQIRFLINFPKKKGFFYPGCQRSSRSPAARSVRVSSAFLAASRLAFVASSLNSVAPSEKKTSGNQGRVLAAGSRTSLYEYWSFSFG